MTIRAVIAGFWSDESGATAIEYGLLAALIGIAVAGAAEVTGGHLQASLRRIAAAFDLGGAFGGGGGGGTLAEESARSMRLKPVR